MNTKIEIGRKRGWMTAVAFSLAVFLACEEVQEVPTDPIPDIPIPKNLTAIVSANGVTLSWEFDTTFAYLGFDIMRSEDQVSWYKQAFLTEPPFVDSNLRTGFPYWYGVVGVDENEIRGKMSAPLTTYPSVYAVLIEGGNFPVTNQQVVTLTFTAASGTQFVKFSEDSLLAGAQWRDYDPPLSYPLTLSVGDGDKTVYAQFRDAAGNLTARVESSIELDTFAEISDLDFIAPYPATAVVDTIAPGGTVFFTVETTGAETGGFVEVYVEGIGATPVVIYDDGRNGDSEAGDGIYEREYTFALSFRQRSMRMSALFVDLPQNPSVEREFDRNLYMSDMPPPVTLSPITEVTSDSITLRWTRSLYDHFFENYSIYRDVDPDVNPEKSVLAASVSDQSVTVFVDQGLAPDTTYYYKVYVVNDLDEGAASNEESGTTTP